MSKKLKLELRTTPLRKADSTDPGEVFLHQGMPFMRYYHTHHEMPGFILAINLKTFAAWNIANEGIIHPCIADLQVTQNISLQKPQDTVSED